MKPQFALVTALVALLALATPAFATEEVSVGELVAMAAELAGAEVVVEGELVGDYGFRNDGWMWTQLNGDVYAGQPLLEGGAAAGGNVGIGIRMPISIGATLDPPGGYRLRGPLVRVMGIWKYHDVARQGESFLEVESIEVIEPGRSMTQDVDRVTVLVGLLLVGVAVATHFIRRPD